MPGDELAVIEEYESGNGTYVINGQIRASVLGETKFDDKNKYVQVKKADGISSLPQANDQVEGILETDKFLKIIKINGKITFGSLSGLMERSRVSIGTSDYIRGTVISLMNGTIHVGIISENDGVMKCSCTGCGDRVVQIQRGVKCVSCGLFKYKRLAPDFR